MKMTKKMRSKRAFTLVEVVVAMAVIVLITAATIGLIASNTKAQIKIANDIYAANITENAIECFKYAGADGFEFKSVFFGKVLGYDEENYPQEEGEYNFESNGVTVTITINGDTITVEAGDIRESFTKK